MRVLLHREVAAKIRTSRRRSVATTSRWLELPPPQLLLPWWVGAEVPEVTSAGTLQTGYPCAQDLKDQPHGSRSVPGAKELWLRHVLRGIEHATRQKRAPVSPRAPWHRARHLPRKGSGVTTCPEAPCAPPARKGLWCCHVPRGTEPITRQERAPESPRGHIPRGSRPTPCAGRLLRRHMTEAPRPPLDGASVSPRVLWLHIRLLAAGQ
jgi:hypothetical protein